MILPDTRGWEVCEVWVQGHLLLASLFLLGGCHEKVAHFSEVLARRGFQFQTTSLQDGSHCSVWAAPRSHCSHLAPLVFTGVLFGV